MIRRLTRAPVTLALALLVLGVNIATAASHAPGAALRGSFGLGAEDLILGHHLVPLFTSVLLANGPLELLAALAAILIVVGLVEQHIGHIPALVAFVVTATGGGVLGTVAQAAGLLTHGVWSTPPADLTTFHPFTPIVGTAMAGSAFAGPLWRRRVRLLGFAGLVVVLLYSGQPGDVYRLAGALVGLVLGVLLADGRPRLTWPRSSHHEVRTLLAVLVAIGAVGPFLALFQRSGYGMLRPLGLLFRNPLPLPGEIHRACLGSSAPSNCARYVLLGRLNSPGTAVLDLLPLIVLLVAAVGLWRGRRAAAWAAVLVNLALGLFAAVYYNLLPVVVDPDQLQPRSGRGGLTLQTVLAVLLPLALAVAVWLNRRHAPVRPTQRVLLGSIAAVVGVVLVGAAAYVGVGLAMPGAFTPRVSAYDLMSNVAERYVPVGFLRLRRLDYAPVTPLTTALSDWIGPAGWLTLLAALVACSVAVLRPRTAADESRVRALLRHGSSGSIAYMATWAGNRYWFSEDGRHAIAYREGSGVALTIGEPIGPPEGATGAARAFAISCDDRGLTPAFYAVRPTFAAGLGSDAPWAAVDIGEDTVLTPATFTLKGKQWQDVRSSINRADRLGVQPVWTDWDSLALPVRAQIEAISEEWIADRRLPELGFTLGGLLELQDREVKLMLAIGPNDRVEAVTSWLPTWRDGELTGWTLDFMRRRADSMNGVMEFLIASVVTRAQQRELEFISLSVAPLATQAASGEPDRIDQLLELIGRVLEPAYGFTSLATFKAKFRPALVGVVLAYPDALSLPAIGVALTRAYLPDLGLAGMAHLLGSFRPEGGEQGAPRASEDPRAPADSRQN